MFSYHLYQKKLKVIFRNNLKKNIEKKWCEWCEGCDYQQVIPKNSTKMVQEWCKGYIDVLYGEGEGGGSYCWCCDMAFSLKVINI